MSPVPAGRGPRSPARLVGTDLVEQVLAEGGRPPAQRAKRLDGRLPASLIRLPEQVTGAVGAAGPRFGLTDLLIG